MRESGYYAPGTEFDPHAPWNEKEIEPVTERIEYSIALRKAADVETTNYEPGIMEQDEDGYMVRDDDDFSATDWAEEFRGQYKTPMQLIEILQDTAKLLKEGIVPNKSKSYWQDVLEQCKGWEADTDNEYAEEAR